MTSPLAALLRYTVSMKLVEIARFDNRLEAEAVGHALDQHGIPFLVQGSDIGIFGPGMVGRSPVEVSLQVPEEALEEVKILLDCVVSIPESSGEDAD